MNAATRPDSGLVETGKDVLARRKRLNASQDEVAEHAGVNRDTIGAVERGGGSGSSRRKIGEALAEMEAEAGLPPWEGVTAVSDPEVGIVTLEVEGVFGVARVAVKGPVSDSAELRRLLAAVIGDLRRDSDDPTPAG